MSAFFELNNGAKIPYVGLGTWNADQALIPDALATAIKVGYRYMNCAQLYGNEKEIGFALKWIFEDVIVNRGDLWITSKLRCSDHSPDDVEKALERTLTNLQLDYLDLIHWPVSLKCGSTGFEPEYLTKPDIPSTRGAMEALHDSGKVRAIGVSNFSIKKLRDLLKAARVPPAVNQVECNPSLQQLQLHSFCKSSGIHLSGYVRLGSPGSTLGKNRQLLSDPVLNMIAEKLGKSPAQVALHWGLQMGHSVLPKSTNNDRLKEIFDWSIPEDLFAKFSEIEQVRIVTGTKFVHETFGAYRNLEELWVDGDN